MRSNENEADHFARPTSRFAHRNHRRAMPNLTPALIARLAKAPFASLFALRSKRSIPRASVATLALAPPGRAVLALRGGRWGELAQALDNEPGALEELLAERGPGRANALLLASAAGATECVARMAPSFDLGERDSHQASALMHAAASGQMGCFLAVRSLCLNEDLIAVDAVGAPSLFYAARGGNPQILRALAAYTAMGWRDHGGRSVFHAAAGAGHAATLREAHELVLPRLRLGLLTQGDEEGQTPLMRAAGNGRLEALKTIIHLAGCAAAAGVHAMDKKGKTALAAAISGSHYDCATYLAELMGTQATPEFNARAFEQAFVAAGRGITRAGATSGAIHAGALFIADLSRAAGVDAREALAQLVHQGKLKGWRAAQAASESSRATRATC